MQSVSVPEKQYKNQLLKVGEVAEHLGVSVSTVWNMCNPKSRHHRPNFPKPFKVSANTTRWLAADVATYISTLAEQAKGTTS